MPVVVGLSLRPGSPAAVRLAAAQAPVVERPESVAALAAAAEIWSLDAVELETFFHP